MLSPFLDGPPKLSVNLYLVWDSSGLQLAGPGGEPTCIRLQMSMWGLVLVSVVWGYSQHPPPIPVEIAAMSSWVMGFPQSGLGGSRKGDSAEKFRKQQERVQGQGWGRVGLALHTLCHGRTQEGGDCPQARAGTHAKPTMLTPEL